MTPNERAFLSMLSHSEGTDKYGDENGYNVLFGGGLFHGYKDHPRQYIHANNITSSAAGRYQILADNYDYYKHSLSLPDFSPNSQDLIALRLITECHALNDINTGHIADAIHKCRSRWASLPGAGYGQPENKTEDLIKSFTDNGGSLA